MIGFTPIKNTSLVAQTLQLKRQHGAFKLNIVNQSTKLSMSVRNLQVQAKDCREPNSDFYLNSLNVPNNTEDDSAMANTSAHSSTNNARTAFLSRFNDTERPAIERLTQDNDCEAFKHLPQWNLVQAKDVLPGLKAMMVKVQADFKALEDNVTPTWSGLIEPLEKIGQQMGSAQARIHHLQSVCFSDDIQTAFDEIRPSLVELSTEMGQSRALFDALTDMKKTADLNPIQRRITDNFLKSMHHQGVSLDGKPRERFLDIQKELASLTSDFSHHLIMEAKNERIKVMDQAQLKGIPDSVVEAALTQAEQDGVKSVDPKTGPWHFTLDGSTYITIIQNCENQKLRQEFYEAFSSRGTQGDYNNCPLLEQILKLKQEKAQLLGFKNAAQVSLDTKMAPSEASVMNLITELKQVASPIAEQELVLLTNYAQSKSGASVELQPWDVAFWNEQYVKENFDVDQEALRQYFQAPVVMDSLFNMMNTLFGLDISQVPQASVPIWHKDVQFYQIKENGQPIAGFYMDPFARPGEKRGGAWMNSVVDKSTALAGEDGHAPLPVALFIQNIRPPKGDKPGLLSLNDVETLFHEFGHAMQHMLTRIDQGEVSGINGVEWDAVEVASQFNENWVYRPEFLKSVSCHVETGESLDDDTIRKIIESRHYFAANTCLRQLCLATVDFRLHQEYGVVSGDQSKTPQMIENEVRKDLLKSPYVESLSSLPAFSHIFAGGYSAGYYSYKWAEVMAADAFAAFEEAGLDNPQALREQAQKYRDTILADGGSRPAGEVFRDFSGRDATPDALLRHQGLKA